MLKSLGAVTIGIILSGISFFILTFISRNIFPKPEDLDPNDQEALKLYFSEIPASELAFLSLSFMISAFIGSYFASRNAQYYNKLMGFAAGLFIFVLALSIFLYMPYPKLYAFGTFGLILLSLAAGGFLGSRAKKTT